LLLLLSRNGVAIVLVAYVYYVCIVYNTITFESLEMKLHYW